MTLKFVTQIQRMFLQLPHFHKILVSVISVALLLLLIIPSEPATASKNTTPAEQLMPGKRYQLELAFEQAGSDKNTERANLTWQTYQIKSGDSLAKVFNKVGYSAQQLYQVTESGEDAKYLRQVYPGDLLRFATDDTDQLVQLVYQLNDTETLIITRQNDSFVAEIETKDVEVRTEFTHAVIDSSFWNAGIDSGLTDNQIMRIANIFGWDIDFALDLRKNDEFSVLYETHYVDGEFVGYGKILAAEFVNRDERFQAILHDNGQYYTPNGRAMRKTFLRSPVNFTYISSSFNPRRLHPVTGRVRPHNGIDYAAATGTPVMSSGDGKVISASYNSLNGNYVFIQHGERYVTKYLHLSRKHVRTGDRVKQGQVIGRVGATGRVTGAHLHYEFLVNGAHRNPRTVELPKAQSLSESELPSFRQHADQVMAILNDNKRVYLAMR
ncbi:OapA family protein [Idiomarina sp. HP20-50]|uniref:OapA family protein n=1 Tax=Idiomarina sp. HP20-50 TaxID=3070813 RepID=UPI00294AC4CE|nr:peptidoglycan DD-metalloendopeptidase family protein [Idiomarina sp. HP20-50]MDV6315575.1 peptidoglycan DD-metalloendopeptidase family protein [Idiomarina sp. HP20-50]